MKSRHKSAHMKASQVYAELSYCKRRKVGCVIVEGDGIVSFGYNGTPAGEDNTCEDETFTTKPNVVHAEMNALKKLAPRESGEDMILFVTRSPCPECAQAIIDFKIPEVYYRDLKVRNGLHLLEAAGVKVTQLQE